ncbi:Transient-receptor-potential-like protein [Toxocara canis]|uniref:Transient-receptor-potential-like protein n=1 Tax=Toxocara canis TaxID=6265 RepID=A0A0B2UZE6_TOXCA|nr:Transient-receptor-potential-like protein [Toxocara canis]
MMKLFELRDDRRKEIVRSSSHIDAVKRDIMRTMSYTQHFSLLRSGRTHENGVTEEAFDGEHHVPDDQPESSPAKFTISEKNTPSPINNSQVFYLPSVSDHAVDSTAVQPLFGASPVRSSGAHQILRLTDRPRIDLESSSCAVKNVPTISHSISNTFPSVSSPAPSLSPTVLLPHETIREIQVIFQLDVSLMLIKGEE